MLMKTILTCSFCIAAFFVSAQKVVYRYPLELPNGLFSKLAPNEFHLLENPDNGSTFFIFNNQKKVEYALVEPGFKFKDKIEEPIKETAVFRSEYIGGIANEATAHFVFEKKKNSETSYIQETVDFNSKTHTTKDLLTIPANEKALFSFTHNNRFFAVAADDKKSELSVYIMGKDGAMHNKRVSFKVPPTKNRKKNDLSEYLDNLRIIKDDEEPGMESASGIVKLFIFKDKLTFLANNEDDPTYLLELDVTTFSVTEKVIDHTAMFAAEDKGKSFVNSFYRDGKLFSLGLNKKDIRVAVYDASNGNMLKSHEINDANSFKMMARMAVSEKREGKKVEQKDIDDFKKLVKALTAGSEGLMITTNKNGQLVVTIGTYDPIPVSSGGGSSGGLMLERLPIPQTPYQKGYQAPVYRFVPRPGAPILLSTSARHYKTMNFKMLLDPASFNVARGRVPLSESEQIKNYIDAQDDSRTLHNKQFGIGDKQYYSFYDRDAKAYVVEQIKITQ